MQVREIAAAPAGNQDLSPGFGVAFQQSDLAAAPAAFGRREEARGAGAQDDDIEGHSGLILGPEGR